MKESYTLSKTNRKASDEKAAEADKVAKEMEAFWSAGASNLNKL